MRKSKNKRIKTISKVSSNSCWVELSELSDTQRKYCSALLKIALLENAFASKAVFELRSKPDPDRTYTKPRSKE